MPAGFVREVRNTIRDYWQNPGAGGGKGRFERAIRRVKHLRPREIVSAIYDDMRDFAPPQDDVSLVAIKRTS